MLLPEPLPLSKEPFFSPAERQNCCISTQAMLMQQKAELHQQRLLLRQQRASLAQEHKMYRQERLRLWNDCQEMPCFQHDAPTCMNIKERIHRAQAFSKQLLARRQEFSRVKDAFEARLHALKEQRLQIQELEDAHIKLQKYQHLRASYQELQYELQEYRRILHEQRESYHQIYTDHEEKCHS